MILSMTNCAHLNYPPRHSSLQPVPARGVAFSHILVYLTSFSLLPAGLGLFNTLIENVTPQIPIEPYPAVPSRLDVKLSVLSSPLLPIPPRNVDFPSSKWYVYSILSTASGLKIYFFIIITLNSLMLQLQLYYPTWNIMKVTSKLNILSTWFSPYLYHSCFPLLR